MENSLTDNIEAEVCILGGGPHGLAAAVYLRRARPDLRTVVVDPAGEWMKHWREQFARAEIATLRSPVVHHPSPDATEFSRFVDRSNLERSGLPYDPPTAEAFVKFCAHLVEETGLDAPLAAVAEDVHRRGPGLSVVTDRATIRCDHLVVAANPHVRCLPEWARPLLSSGSPGAEYGGDVDLRSLPDLRGERITVVGGGMTAAHLVCGAANRGADVHMVTRRPLHTRNFDTDPGWLGPRFLDDFDRDRDPRSRLSTARAARRGGTVPPWLRDRVDAHVAGGRVTVHDGNDVRAVDVSHDGSYVMAVNGQRSVTTDRIWLATGTTPDIGALRCLNGLVSDSDHLEGLPITDEALRIGELPVYAMGRLAVLTLGPAAGNLWGAQRAAGRITAALTGLDMEGDLVGPRPVQAGRR